MAEPKAAIHQRGAVAKKMIEHAAMVPMDQRLAERLTAPLACQSRIIGPYSRCASSHACSFSEPFAAAQAASSTKGVVGRPGRKMPMMPRPSAR